jgi:hypothetical protein
LLALLFLLGLLLTSVGTAVAQDRYEELLEALPEVELGSACTAEEEGDLAAVPGTIVTCAPTADDPDQFWWREASGDEVDAALEHADEPDTDASLPETGGRTLLTAGLGLLALLVGGVTLRLSRLPRASASR